MGRKCSVYNCRSGYKWNPSKFNGIIYGFPKDKSEKELWIRALPNASIANNNITDNMGICELHWPLKYPTRRSGRYLVPAVAPSIFIRVPQSCCRQTGPKKLRNVNVRRVSSEIRKKLTEKRVEQANQQKDKIKFWDDFISYCDSLDLVKDKHESFLTLFKFNYQDNQPPSISFSITITYNFKVTSFKEQIHVPIRQFFGFNSILERYSQLREIISFVCDYEPELRTRFAYTSEIVKKNSQEILNNEQRERVEFLARQLELCSFTEHGRRYSAFDFKNAIGLFLRSRNCYSALREFLILPHPRRIESLFGTLSDPGSVQECTQVVKTVFMELEGPQKYCKILVDEVYIKPSIRYQGNHIIGFATDTAKPARTMLALILCPIFGAPAFVARLIPIYSLSAELIYTQVIALIKIIRESSGYVYLVMNDNLAANIKFFRMLHEKFVSVNNYSIQHPVPNDVFRLLFTLYDTIHLFKNIKNNWTTEKMKKLRLCDPLTHEEMNADFGHVIAIYQREKNSIIKQTKLAFSTVFPTNFDKQKVDLMLNLFNEKTVAVLRTDGNHGTATFVRHVTRLFHMLNVKNLYSGQAYNDPDREAYRSIDDPRFDYIMNMALTFKKMDTSLTPYSTRVMCLTKQTSNALSLTLNGMVVLIQTLLSKPGIHYVLSGTMQSDRLEAEFGIYRQLNGGNFYMSSEQIKNSLKLQRIKIFDRLDIYETVVHYDRVLFR